MMELPFDMVDFLEDAAACFGTTVIQPFEITEAPVMEAPVEVAPEDISKEEERFADDVAVASEEEEVDPNFPFCEEDLERFKNLPSQDPQLLVSS